MHGFYSNNTLFFQAVFSYTVLCLRPAFHDCGTPVILSVASEQEQSPPPKGPTMTQQIARVFSDVSECTVRSHLENYSSGLPSHGLY